MDIHTLVSWGDMRVDEKMKALRRANATLRTGGKLEDLEPRERIAVLVATNSLLIQLDKETI